MTREAFLIRYRELLREHCDWAADAEMLAKFMRGAQKTISNPGGSSWSFDTPLAQRAYREVTGQKRATLKALRALPSEERTT